ncbi:MAG: hypothetical protein ABFC96_11205 [Thermoguttaceae bacterium]
MPELLGVGPNAGVKEFRGAAVDSGRGTLNAELVGRALGGAVGALGGVYVLPSGAVAVPDGVYPLPSGAVAVLGAVEPLPGAALRALGGR